MKSLAFFILIAFSLINTMDIYQGIRIVKIDGAVKAYDNCNGVTTSVTYRFATKEYSADYILDLRNDIMREVKPQEELVERLQRRIALYLRTGK